MERKMFCQAFGSLACIAPLSTYRYIGFGSVEFVDFKLFHQRLGITDMISIEGEDDPQKQERVKFNLPYSCIQMEWDVSSIILPTLTWKKRTIIWLDYDRPLNELQLDDIRLVTSQVESGSILIITVDVEPEDVEPEDVADEPNIHKKRIDNLKSNVGSDKVPVDVKGASLSKWGLARVCRRIVDNEIKQALMDRNAPISQPSRMEYRQLFNIHYADSTKMLTVGGVFLDPVDQTKFSNVQLEGMDFISYDENEYLIETPILTLRELRRIDSLLPSTKIRAPKGIPQDNCEKYSKVYRYFPLFGEVEAM